MDLRLVEASRGARLFTIIIMQSYMHDLFNRIPILPLYIIEV